MDNETEVNAGNAPPRGAGAAKKVVIVAVLAIAVGFALWAKGRGNAKAGESVLAESTPETAVADVPPSAVPLPRLVDLGAGQCIPCKMMAPILEELKKECAGRLEVAYIDVVENPDLARSFGIELIPTQIFFDSAGKELFRHEGFFAKEDILAKWKELGVDLQTP